MSRRRPGIAGALVAVLLLGVAATVGYVRLTGKPDVLVSSPPLAGGYLRTLPPGSWSRLPGDARCAGRVRRSTWEPRPENTAANQRMPDAGAVHAALAARPRARQGAYDPRWDSWLLARVSGHVTGTTDEIIQWAACKWGLADNLVRAIAVRESSWFQDQVDAGGRCVLKHGCGDLPETSTPALRVYCAGIAGAGRDYTRDFGDGVCPKTFSIVGVMSWQDPAWGPMPGNQNGTFPFNRDSTAFALDYLGAFLRGCDEGWATWLGARGAPYRPGDIWGCVGTWYAGSWWSPEAKRYIGLVQTAERDRPWLDPAWAGHGPPCDPDRGCPNGGS